MKAKDLRNSILQMAVQGQLVPQDPNDEPASVLLERIREERHRLYKQGALKFPKGSESIIYTASDGSPYEKRVDVRGRVISDESIADEIPFDIPESWAWARFSELVPIQYGFPADSQQFNLKGKIGLIRIRDVNSGDLVHTVTRYDGDYDNQYVVHQGDDLIGMDGEFVCKRWQGEDALLNQRVCRLRYLGNTVSHDFIAYAIDWYLSEIWKVTSKTTVKHLSAKAMDELLFAVPPLAEQERIAAKTLEISPLVDEYGAFEDAREVLDSALPSKLRQSVLQEAVEGRLVSQNPNDEPASVLLERIRQERRELIAQGKLKFPKDGESIIYTRSDGARYEKRVNQRGRMVSDECIEDEIPFKIPESWTWARLADCCLAIVDCPHSTPKYLTEETGYFPDSQADLPAELGGSFLISHIFSKNGLHIHSERYIINYIE